MILAMKRLHVERALPTELLDLVAPFDVVGPDLADLADAEGAIVSGLRWDGAMMDTAPRMRVLARVGIGVDNVDLDAATERSILVTNTPDGPTIPTAEHTLALLFAVTKKLGVAQDRLRRQTGDYHAGHDGFELAGRTLGLVGYGRIARRVARACMALDMDVIACDPFVDIADVEIAPLETVLDRCDVLSIHAPLTPETHHLVDGDALARLRRGAIVVNCARGGLLDPDALLAALESGQVAAAGLDVTEPEPLPAEHPLLHRDDVLVTPHVASATVAGKRRMYEMAVEQVTMAFSGLRPTELVNPEVWSEPG